MRYLFNFSFAFDDLNEDTLDEDRDDDMEVDALEMSFLVNEAGIKALGITDPDPTKHYAEEHADWMGEITSEFEEEFNAVHDVFGTHDDLVLVEGFMTYEIETVERARELVEYPAHLIHKESIPD